MLDEDTTFPECTRAIDKARLDMKVPESQRVLLEPDISDSGFGHGLIVFRMLFQTAQVIRSTYESHQLPCGYEDKNDSAQIISSVVQRARASTSVFNKLPQSLEPA